jgi:hypothetical protein
VSVSSLSSSEGVLPSDLAVDHQPPIVVALTLQSEFHETIATFSIGDHIDEGRRSSNFRILTAPSIGIAPCLLPHPPNEDFNLRQATAGAVLFRREISIFAKAF